MIQIDTVSNHDQIVTVTRLASGIWTEHYKPIIGQPQVDYMLERFQSISAIKQQIADGARYDLVLYQGIPAGYSAWIPGDEKEMVAFISKLYVDSRYRGFGLGYAALAHIEQQACHMGLRHLKLTVNRHNRGSIDWYIRQGFYCSGLLTMDIGGGFAMDDYSMEKPLGNDGRDLPVTVDEPPSVLFLCTGNYYRSRFAETLFAHLAEERGLDWQAMSAGLAIELIEPGAGNLSIHAETGLKALGLKPDKSRGPRACRDAMLLTATRVIALHETEHRALVEKRHPAVADKVEYWHVPDLDGAVPRDALAAIETLVRRLVEELFHSGRRHGKVEDKHNT